MAAFAGALGVRLGGPTGYEDGVENYPFWGTGRADLDSLDLLAAERLALRSALFATQKRRLSERMTNAACGFTLLSLFILR